MEVGGAWHSFAVQLVDKATYIEKARKTVRASRLGGNLELGILEDEEFIDEWLETWAEWPSPSNRHLRRAGRAASHDGVVEPGVWAYPVQREQHPPPPSPVPGLGGNHFEPP